MSKSPDNPKTHAQLRQTAEVRIRGGLAPATHGWTMGATSLGLLHRLASDASTASDALKLLHELQVHQVELDLQHEHMDEERQALEQQSVRLFDLFVSAPVAYFMVNGTGHVVEANTLAARLLGVSRDDVGSCNLSRLVLPASRVALQALLTQVLSSGARHSCKVQAPGATNNRFLEVIASSAPGALHCQVVVLETENAN